jgi:hypothetical protein
MSRPTGADAAIVNDLPNEDGVPNHRPDPAQPEFDNHDILTGSNDKGQLYGAMSTCFDWTSARGDRAGEGAPRVGHSWPRMGGPGGLPPRLPDGGVPDSPGRGIRRAADGGMDPLGPPGGVGDMANWMSALDEAGCAAGVNIIESGPPHADNPTVGSGGGYGGIYCLASIP